MATRIKIKTSAGKLNNAALVDERRRIQGNSSWWDNVLGLGDIITSIVSN